jgi:hypothetical protein
MVVVLGPLFRLFRGAVELFDRVGEFRVSFREGAPGFDALRGVPLRFQDASELPAN